MVKQNASFFSPIRLDFPDINLFLKEFLSKFSFNNYEPLSKFIINQIKNKKTICPSANFFNNTDLVCLNEGEIQTEVIGNDSSKEYNIYTNKYGLEGFFFLISL